jgi:phage-related protein (TIGR01555 family)
VVGNFKKALAWEDLYGGSVIYMGLDDGQVSANSQSLPVRWERLQKVLWLKVVDRRRIRPSHEPADIDQDPRSPTFGEALWFLLYVNSSGNEVRVHRSRLIIFPGTLTSEYLRWARQGWGISVLDPIYEALQRNATAWQSAGNALANAQYVIYKLKGLMHMFSLPDGEDKAKKRARAMELAKSMINAVLIDSEDDYVRENPNFGNMPEMLEAFMLDVCAQCGWPATVLWGRSPQGMNATGESDLQLWDNVINAKNEHHVRPRAQQLVLALMQSKEGPTAGLIVDGWRVYFPPRREMNEVQKADVRLKTSQADASDITAGILLPQEVAMSRYRPEGYSTETQIDLELRKKLLKLELDRHTKMLQEPTPSELAEQAAKDKQPEDKVTAEAAE